jgi:hypothetical protein
MSSPWYNLEMNLEPLLKPYGFVSMQIGIAKRGAAKRDLRGEKKDDEGGLYGHIGTDKDYSGRG